MADRRRVARYYPVARTAHLERLATFHPGDFLYERHRMDWDQTIADAREDVRQISFLRLLGLVLIRRYRTIEVPEPLAVAVLPKLLILVLVRILSGSSTKRPRTQFVTYAIENADVSAKVRSKSGLPYVIIRLLLRRAVRLVLGACDRVVFGTDGAHANYHAVLGSTGSMSLRNKSYLVPALPASEVTKEVVKNVNKVIFLGAFDTRKGVLELLRAWRWVAEIEPQLQLELYGHGPLTGQVQRVAASLYDVSVHVDAPRDDIRGALTSSKVLVLLPVRTRLWREQIGLPIVEGLSHGCLVVSTTESGIAPWLQSNGHEVIDNAKDERVVAAAIVRAVRAKRTVEELISVLPVVDGRQRADDILFATERFVEPCDSLGANRPED